MRIYLYHKILQIDEIYDIYHHFIYTMFGASDFDVKPVILPTL